PRQHCALLRCTPQLAGRFARSGLCLALAAQMVRRGLSHPKAARRNATTARGGGSGTGIIEAVQLPGSSDSLADCPPRAAESSSPWELFTERNDWISSWYETSQLVIWP